MVNDYTTRDLPSMSKSLVVNLVNKILCIRFYVTFQHHQCNSNVN